MSAARQAAAEGERSRPGGDSNVSSLTSTATAAGDVSGCEEFSGRGLVVWAHGRDGYLDLATDIMVAVKASSSSSSAPSLSSLGSDSIATAATCTTTYSRSDIILRAVGVPSSYNCIRAAAYAQPFLDPISGSSCLAFTLSTFTPEDTIAPSEVRNSTRTARGEVREDVRAARTPHDVPVPIRGRDGGLSPVSASNGDLPDPQSKIPDLATLRDYQSKGAYLVDFSFWRTANVSFEPLAAVSHYHCT